MLHVNWCIGSLIYYELLLDCRAVDAVLYWRQLSTIMEKVLSICGRAIPPSQQRVTHIEYGP